MLTADLPSQFMYPSVAIFMLITLTFYAIRPSDSDWWWRYFLCWSPLCVERVPQANSHYKVTWHILTILIGIVTLTSVVIFGSNIQQAMLIKEPTGRETSFDHLADAISSHHKRIVMYSQNNAIENQMRIHEQMADALKRKPPTYETAVDRIIDATLNQEGIFVSTEAYISTIVSKMTPDECRQVDTFTVVDMPALFAGAVLQKNSHYLERISFNVAERFEFLQGFVAKMIRTLSPECEIHIRRKQQEQEQEQEQVRIEFKKVPLKQYNGVFLAMAVMHIAAFIALIIELKMRRRHSDLITPKVKTPRRSQIRLNLGQYTDLQMDTLMNAIQYCEGDMANSFKRRVIKNAVIYFDDE